MVTGAVEATTEDFKVWMRDHPEFVSKKIIKESEDWGRLICTWHEKKGDKSIKHIFAAVVDLKTGDVYLDCRIRKIWTKNVALACARPLHTVIKTLYHLSLVGVAREIYLTARGRQTKTEGLKNIVKSLADIVRTPVYGVALTIINLASVVFSPFSTQIAYDLRRLHGHVEQNLNWGEKHTNWTLAFCFQSGFNVYNESYGADAPKRYTKELYEHKKSNLEAHIAKLQRKIDHTNSPEDKEDLGEDMKDLNEKLSALNASYSVVNIENQIAEKKRALKNETSDPEKQQIKADIKQLKQKVKQLDKDNEATFLKKLRMKKQDTHYNTGYDRKINDCEDQIHQLKLKSQENPDKRLEYRAEINQLKQEISKLKEERNLDNRLTNFARAMIRERRNTYNPFYQIIGRLEPKKQYVSSLLIQDIRDYLSKAKKHIDDLKLSIQTPHLPDFVEALKNIKRVVKIIDREFQSEEKNTEKIQQLREEGKNLLNHLLDVGFTEDATVKAQEGDLTLKTDFAPRLGKVEGVWRKASGTSMRLEVIKIGLSHREKKSSSPGPNISEISKLIKERKLVTKLENKTRKGREVNYTKIVEKGTTLTFEKVVQEIFSSKAEQIKRGELSLEAFQDLIKFHFSKELADERGTQKHPQTMFSTDGTQAAQNALKALCDLPEFKAWSQTALNLPIPTASGEPEPKKHRKHKHKHHKKPETEAITT